MSGQARVISWQPCQKTIDFSSMSNLRLRKMASLSSVQEIKQTIPIIDKTLIFTGTLKDLENASGARPTSSHICFGSQLMKAGILITVLVKSAHRKIFKCLISLLPKRLLTFHEKRSSHQFKKRLFSEQMRNLLWCSPSAH